MIVTSASRALLGLFFIWLLLQHLLHFNNCLSFDRYFSLSYTFRLSFIWLLLNSASCALLGLFFIGLLRQLPLYLKANCLSFDCYFSFSCTFRIVFHSIVSLASRALLDCLSFDYYVTISRTLNFLSHCYVSISRTIRIAFHPFVTLTSHFSPKLVSFFHLSYQSVRYQEKSTLSRLELFVLFWAARNFHVPGDDMQNEVGK